MAEPATLAAWPAPMVGTAAASPGAGARARVPLSIWPAIPAPGCCPASPDPVPCPRRYIAPAAAVVITALSRPGDLVAVPGPGDGVFLAAATGAARRVAPAVSPRCSWPRFAAPDQDTNPEPRSLPAPCPAGACPLLCFKGGEVTRAALAVTTCCPVPGCMPPPGTADRGGHGDTADPDPGPLFAACQRALRPGGLLAVITTAARHPRWAGEVIAHARAAGLIYTQHVIALHAPIDGSRLASPWPCPGAPATAGTAQMTHLPAHTDLLLLTKPGGPDHD